MFYNINEPQILGYWVGDSTDILSYIPLFCCVDVVG